MPLSADISTALHLLEHVQERVEDCDDPKLQMHTSQDIKSLISLLEDPVFRSIVTIQDSLIELNTQLGQHPSIIPGDFDINISGQLELSVPTTPIQPLGSNVYQDLYQDSSELEDQRVPVVPLVHSSSEDTSAQVTSPSLVSEVMGMPPITTTTYAKEFKKVIEAAARGRQTFTVQLYKPEGTSLGFSVVGLRSKDKGELGIFLQEVQPNGIAGCDGRLVEGDQILAIDGQPLDSNISHEQAISILQKARGLVELVVARSAQDVGSSLPTDELSGASSTSAAAGAGVSIIGGVVGGTNQASPDKDQSVSTSSIVTPAPTPKSSQPASIASGTTPTPTPPTSTPVPGGLVVERSPSAVSDASKSGSDMVLNTEWAQVEVINLINDGSGLGFGIVGGRSTGVVVKTILPGGVADRDNRLQSGDHILQIGDVNLRGMGSEQVAAVLRQSGTHVRLVVARPVEPTSPDYQALGSHAPIVPTKILGDPDELDRHLVHSVPETYNMRHVQPDNTYDNGYMYSQESDVEMHARPGLIMDVVRNPMPIGAMPVIPAVPVQMPELPVLTMDTIDVNSLPEMERFTVELKKDIYGLGITIAGYVCEKEELSGIFVKSISEGSAADLSNKIQINDRIVEVDGHSLQGYSNHEAVEVLRRTGQTVVLCLERYLRGPKYDQLQQAIAASELRPPQPSSPSITSLPSFPISADGETTTEIEPEGESHTTVDSAVLQEGERERATEELDDAANVEALLSDPSSELTPQIRAAIKAKWQKIVGPDTEIVVAQLKKFAEGSGLGISLEGTVDVENGQEVRPHHYIRSILPEGPVGQNGTLRSGDELLEVNGYRLLGINHMEVVSVLKELPIHVRMVCGRNIASQDPLCPIDTAQHQAAFQTRSILGGSLQNLLPTMDRLVKAKSDGSLASTTTTATVTDASLNKMKSRSLEPLTGLAMWSSEPQIIELVKGERGLGFSILDYQDPMNPNETVIVIRSLVPGGVAQVDGQLIPGDRLLFVNDIALENATLDQAVQALKGAPKGTVRIGVAKPLPIPDSIVQRVPPICPVRRSKSFPNESETTDHAAELEDFLSSRSGVTELSMDKPVSDEDEEHWKDASPITPTCSPTKHPPRTSRQRRHPKSVAVEIHDYEPTSPLHEKDVIIIDSSATPPSKKLALEYNQELSAGLEKVAPKVKLKREPMTECKESEELAEARSRPSTSSEKHADTERGRSLVRTDSEEGLPSSRDVVCKSDASEKGAKKKIYKKRDQDRRSSRRKKGDAEESSPQVSKIEPDDSKMQKEPEEIVIRSREETKSLREQECIERVTEFLTKHSVLTYSDVPPGSEPEVVVQHTADGREQRVTRPSSLLETQEPPVQVLPTEESSSTLKKESSQRPEELAKTPSSLESEKQMITPVRTPVTGSDRTPGSVDETKTSTTTPDTEVPIIKRKSSMRKKPGIFSRESSRESLLDETKKEVRIQENVEEIYFEVRRSSRRKEGDAEESSPQVSKIEPDDSKMQKEPEEIVIRSREERKSLREQECIERVTEFLRDQWILTKHSVLTYSDVLPGFEPEVVVQPTADGREQRVTRPSSLLEPQEPPVQVPPTEESSSTPKKESSQRAEELAKTPSSLESEKQMITPVRTPVTVSDRTPGSVGETKTSATTPDTEVPIIKRRSSMRKKPGIFSRESSRESLLDETKKEVRIQENVEEIYFEDTSEQISGILPEVQLVKARIITAEEAAANRVDEPMRIEVHSPPEVAVVSDSVRVKTGRVPSPETVNLSQLQLLSLAKSTSENTLMDTGDVNGDENRISERNIKAEILLDLSKVPDVGEEEGSIDREKKDRKLSRTGSENSRRSLLKGRVKSRDQGGFKIGSLAQPDVPELMILLESAAFGRRKTDDDDDLDSLVDYGVEEEIRRTRDPKADAGSRVTLDQDVESPSKTSQPDHTLDNEAKLLEGDDHPGQPDGETEFKDYDRALWQRRPLLEETVPFRPEEDSLISKEHSLEYQSQTLESQSENLLLSTSLESLLKSTGGSWPGQLDRSGEETERSFKETQYSPKERHDAETQTEQETKSTQCSPEQSIVSTSEVSRDSPVHFSRGYYQSPRKEVQTQTQGENKSVQCCLDELESLSRSVDFEESFDSPSRSEKSYVKESKSVQCIPEDISVSPGKSVDGEDKSFKSDCLCRSPRREVEVQTCQESKAIQCSDDEILEVTTGQTSEPEGKSSRRTTDSPGTSSCGSPRKLPTLVFVEERTDMTVTQRDHEGNVNWSKHWGPERLVEIYREPKTSLGLSIVGGKVDLHNGSSSKSQNISGIFIKNVLPNSPAGRTGELKIGDRIIEVDGVDVRHSTHERAVEVIQAAGNPVCLRVQSLVHLSNEHEGDGEEGGRSGVRQNSRSRLPGTPTVSFRHKTSPVSPVRSSTPEVTQGGVEDVEKESSSKSDFRRQSTRASDGAGSSSRRSSMKKSIRKKAPSPPSNPGILREVSEEKEDNASKPEEPPKRKYSSDESSEEDTRELEGNVYTKAGMEISRKSAGNVKRSKAEIDADPEQEDEFGYTSMKIQKKYHSMGHKVVLVKVEKDRRGLGISLAGHRDRNRMAVFVCGLNPKGPAHKAGELVVGDEILEVNGCVLQGRCHLNASALIKGMAGPCFKIIVLRKSSALNDLAVKPIVQFPPTLEDSDVFNQFKGVRNIPVKKGQYGLGIMIIEGKHAEVGQGIFISDIQEGSAAEQAGLQVGDMILAVNMDCLLGSTYDEATNLLKKAEGVVTLAVCNPNQSKVAKEEEDRAKGIIPEPEPEPAKEPEKPKEPEPPQDPKDCKIVAGRDTTIEFQKEKDKGIGLIIAGGSDTPMKGVFIVEVFPDGAAGKDGRLQSGDQILDMCKQNFKDMEHDKAHASVLQASGTITMVVHRHEKGDEEVEVELQKKSGKGAGLCLTGYKSGKGAYVSDLLPGGSALESGKICKGDRVIAVGGQDVREAPVEDIAVHVKVSNPVQLKLARFKSAKQ